MKIEKKVLKINSGYGRTCSFVFYTQWFFPAGWCGGTPVYSRAHKNTSDKSKRERGRGAQILTDSDWLDGNIEVLRLLVLVNNV